ncbi:MAG: hypothetical protein RJQ09_09105 [Cyclobacteriaceae bacterium]
MKKLIPILLSILLNHHIRAQNGDYLLTHYDPAVVGVDNVNYDMIVDKNGMLSIANRSGVLQFDGKSWQFIATPMAALSITVSNDGSLYVGGVNDYGYIGLGNSGFEFFSLNANDQQGLFFQAFRHDDVAFFLSQQTIIAYSEDGSVVLSAEAPDNNHFLTVFELRGQLFVQSDLALYIIDNGELIQSDLRLPDNSEIEFITQNEESKQYLIGSTLNNIYLADGEQMQPVEGINKYLRENDTYVFQAVWITADLLALSTIDAGCLIFNAATGALVSAVDQGSGLPDNEIMAIASDNEEGLWVAHEFGLTRVVPKIPVRSFSNYTGIEGNPLAISMWDDKIYVSTNDGVYFLDKEEVFQNTVYYTVVQNKKSKPSPKFSVKEEEQPTEDKKRKKKGFLKGLFSGSNDDKEEKEVTGDEDEEKKKKGFFGRLAEKITQPFSGEVKTIKGKSDEVKYKRNVKRELISTNFVYQKVDGIGSKIKQFTQYKGHLLASGNSGLYEIDGETSHLVIDEHIRFVNATSNGTLIIGTYNNSVKEFELDDDLWIEVAELPVYNQIIVGAFSDAVGRNWLISNDQIHQIDLESFDQPIVESYQIPNQFIDHPRTVSINDRIYLINNLGYFFIDESAGMVKADSTLLNRLGQPIKHLQQSNGLVWIFDGSNWHRISADGAITEMRLADLFPNMSFIDEIAGNLWVVDDFNDVYKLNLEEETNIKHANKMFVREIMSKNGPVSKSGNLTFNFDNNSIRFELSRPDYLGIAQVEYQYQLVGLMTDWSEWSSNNIVDFNYLPPNEYSLVARSKDAFGEIQVSEEFQFTIQPPYWQRPWFYAVQILVFASMIYGSVRLNKATARNYALLTEGLTLFTIILTIEFLQTIAGSSLGIETSPVIDFAIDASIAVMIFPFELVLKKVIKSGGDKTALKKLLKPKEIIKVD